MSTAPIVVSQLIASARTAEVPVLGTFVARWSRRALSSRPIPEDAVRALFEAARWAPSASNSQPWLFVFNDDEESLARARPLVSERNRAWADRAPLLVFVFARRQHPETGKPLRTGAFDTGAAWFALALQAQAQGLSTRAIGGMDHERAYDVLGVPRDEFESMAAIAVGYPGAPDELPADFAAREVPSARRSTSTFAFRGRYRASAAD
jgi:nitroreductase